MLAISTICCTEYNLADRVPDFFSGGVYHFECLAAHAQATEVWSDKPWKISNLAIEPTPRDGMNAVPALTSDNPHDRQRAVNQVVALCQQARLLKAPYVVIWPGYVPFWSPPTTAGVVDEKNRQLRRDMAPAFIQRLCRSLHEINRNEPDIGLCLPPAAAFDELPWFDELQWILDDLPKLPLWYWHNTASCHLLEKMGLTPAEAWLSQYGSKLAGIHIEDIVQERSRYLPGMGEVKFARLADYLPARAIRVLRVDSSFGDEEIWTGCQYLRDLDIV